MKYIDQEWTTFKASCVPAEAGPAQVQDTRDAFFAGAFALMHTIMTLMSPETEPTEADYARMNELQQELDEWQAACERRAGKLS